MTATEESGAMREDRNMERSSMGEGEGVMEA